MRFFMFLLIIGFLIVVSDFIIDYGPENEVKVVALGCLIFVIGFAGVLLRRDE